MLPTIHEAAALIRAGKLSSGDLLEACLANIDRHEDRVRAWVLVDRDRARADAKAADAERARGIDRGPLHGIPIGIKDIIDVFDWPTGCGSRRWVNAFARQDAPVVAKLRHAGAVLIGKTVTTAYASFDPPPTRNPWDLSRTPGGSSSGSAAAVAAGMCLAALGTQTGGSITRPASYCGVASCKPSYGRTSLRGVMPLAHSMDHIGPMARAVWDLALVMQVISRPGEGDWMPGLENGTPPSLGRLRGDFERRASAEVNAAVEAACVALAGKSAQVHDVRLPAEFEDIQSDHAVIMAVEAATYHEPRFRRHPEDYPARITSLIEQGLAYPAPVYSRAKQRQRELTTLLAQAQGDHSALLCPATTIPAPPADTTGDPSFNSPWSFCGAPAVSIPIGLAPTGLPLGVQFVAARWREADVFRVASWCERALAVNLGTPRALS